MIPSDEESRRALAATFMSPGWNLIKQELERRKEAFKYNLIYSNDRSRDTDCRAGIVAIDMLLKMEKELFATPAPESQPFRIPESPNGNRY